MQSIEAMITWTPNREPFENNPTRGQVMVIRHNVDNDDNNITHSVGACDHDWIDIGVQGRQERVENIYRQMVNEDNIDPDHAKQQINQMEDIVIT